MPASIIAPYIISALGGAAVIGGFAAAAITFGVRLVTTYVISTLIAKRGDDAGGAGTGTRQVGNRVQLAPATDNKIPVVYGSSFMKPIVVDAKISQDQKTMWYVMVFSEAMENDSIGTFSFGDIYWGDKKLIFDETDQTMVTSWINSDGSTETQPNGLLNFYLYRDGSLTPTNTTSTAIEILQDYKILPGNRWTSTNKMTKLVFAIARLQYSQEKGITNLSEVTAVVNNSLTKPGAVIRDYLTNSRYGAGLNISKVYTDSLTALDTYSDQTISYTPAGGGSKVTTSRYRINGPVDTTKNFLDNVVNFADAADSWLQWNEARGQWAVVINRSYLDTDPSSTQLRKITSGEIIGGINLNPIDLNSTYSRVEVQFPNTKIKDQPGYYSIGIDSFPNVQPSPNEPENILKISLPYTNNVVRAQYIAARRLLQSREDLVITFTMAFSGITIDAGDVIGITHEVYGWGSAYGMPYGKLFRVTQVQESKSDDGMLYARIIASEYNNDVYDDNNIDLADFTPALNTGISDPTIITTPAAPTILNLNTSSATPSFDVRVTVPSLGTTLGLEYWYGTTSTISGNNYTLYATELPSGGPVFATGTNHTLTVTGLGDGVYWWAAKGVGARTKSSFSGTTPITWAPRYISEVTGQYVLVTFQPPILSVPRLGYDLVPDYSNVRLKAYGAVGAQKANYVDVLTDSDPTFTYNTWRIATNSSNNYTTTGVVTLTNITLNLASITPSDGGVLFPAPTSITDFPAFVQIPVRYKDAAGNIFQSTPAIAQLTFNNQLETGPAISFINPILGVPRYTDDLVPDFDGIVPAIRCETSTGTVIPFTLATSDSDARFVNNSWRISGAGPTDTTAIRIENVTIDRAQITTATSGLCIFPQPTNMSYSPATITVYPRYKNSLGQVYDLATIYESLVFADQGASAVSVDFDFTGGAFTKNTNSTFTPANLTVQALVGNWGATSVSWVTSGTSTSTISTSVVTNDTIFFAPSTTTSRVSLTATAASISTSTKKTVAFSVLQQPTDGVKGDQGNRGFVPLAYIPILVDPATATNGQLTAAWTAQTGYAPINQDCGSFTFGDLNKAWTYNGTTWDAAAVSISGDLVATGTIRANRLAANEIFTNKLASTTSTGTNFGSTTTTVGYWIDGSTGNARFAGNVTIGSNLVVDGLITGSTLNQQVVSYNNLQSGIVPAPAGLNYSAGTINLATSSTYDWYFSSGFYYGYEKILSRTEIPVTSAMTQGSNSILVTFKADAVISGVNAYPSGPIFVLYGNDNTNGGSGVAYFVPASASPLPSGANATGSQIFPQFGRSLGSGITNYNNTIQLSTLFTFPTGMNTLTTGTTLVVGAAVMNGDGSVGSNLGTISLSNIRWSATLA